MKFFKQVFNWLSLILFLGGIGVILFAYFNNKAFLNYISGLLSDPKFGNTMKMMLIGIAMIIVSLLLFSFALRLGGKIKRKEKERAAAEKARLAEEEKKNKALREEADKARAEAEKMRQEAEKAQEQLRSMSNTEVIDTSGIEKP